MAPDKHSLYGKPIGSEPSQNDQDGCEGDVEPRCEQCNKLLAILVTRPWVIRCVRCKRENKKP